MNFKLTNVISDGEGASNRESWFGLSTDVKPGGKRAGGSTFICEDKFLSETEGWLYMWKETSTDGAGVWEQKLPRVG